MTVFNCKWKLNNLWEDNFLHSKVTEICVLNMKKSKPDPIIKKKTKNLSLKLKKKRQISSQTEENPKVITKEKVSKKTRWEDTTGDNQNLQKSESPVLLTKIEEENVRESPRIKSLLEDKKKMVEQLFITVSGKALEDIIPDYLRKRSVDELKKLCFVELEKMTDDEILDTISGRGPPILKEQETQTDFRVNLVDAVEPEVEEIKPERENEQPENIEVEINEAQNQASPEVLEEVAKDLGISDGDAELLELEMRARAIRSLLKLKSNEELS